MTTRRPTTLQEQAMYFGTCMGLFWIFKFIFLPTGFTVPLLQLLFILMTLFVPVLGYIYARRYRNTCCGGSISFLKAFAFTVFMYMFASLLTAVAHYVYFRFIDNGYLVNTYISTLESMDTSALTEEMKESVRQLTDALGVISSLSPLEMALQLLSQNFFYGVLLALPTALLTMKRKK
ncbi:MAG TPA: DUF4199 domain-containing protein [Candidatus Phocaeicola excrementigallinarum]|nr:DUF4199 domain-containing protein [Candidatus Phocaeicola excrementigallinarum]